MASRNGRSSTRGERNVAQSLETIPNNVDLSIDRRLQRALEQWQPNFLQWWKEVGPDGFQARRVFRRDGGEGADEPLRRGSGCSDKPRILNACNEPIDGWLSLFMFTMFTDRDGKYQLAALAQSGFDPLARTRRFMLTGEAHPLF